MISWLLFDYLLEALQWALSKTWQMFSSHIILSTILSEIFAVYCGLHIL